MKITEAIDSVAFKHALFEGIVEFDYDKADGTVRHAHGTMNEALLPKVEPIVAKFSVEVDKWAKSENTPKRRKFKISVTQLEIDEWGADAMDNIVEDAILKKTGCAADEFSYWPIDMDDYDETPRKMPDDSVFYYDLDKKGFRSFKLANLKGWKSC